jgi:hypothetical protein
MILKNAKTRQKNIKQTHFAVFAFDQIFTPSRLKK